MDKKTEEQIQALAKIIKSLADVWPNDRENVMKAGADFEYFVNELENPGLQLKKLIDLAWQGMIHLHEKNEYFISVKNATMEAVNTVREYLLKSGNITVDTFETSYDRLEKALNGFSESADKIIDLPAPEASNDNEYPQEVKKDKPEPLLAHYSLNDIASKLIELSEESAPEKIQQLLDMVNSFTDTSVPVVVECVKEITEILQNAINDGDIEWIHSVSEKIEQAIMAAEDQEWENPASDTTMVSEQNADRGKAIKINQQPEAQNEFRVQEDIDIEMIKEFINECNDLIETAESALLDLESDPENQELVNTVFRAFHTIKGTSAFMGLNPISDFTHLAETLLSNIRDGLLKFNKASADICLDSIDIIKKLLENVSTIKGGELLYLSDQYHLLLAILNEIAENGMLPEEALDKAGLSTHKQADSSISVDNEINSTQEINELTKNGTTEIIEKEQKTEKNEKEATVRVNLGRLDRLIDMVGELVIAHSVVSQHGSIANDTDLLKKVTHTTKILRELQDTSLTLRMVPLRATFQKMNRLVRDLARKAGKNVKFTTLGDDTELDRNMVDIINEPLVHMLRNSIDHGVEFASERTEANKTNPANIWIRAFQEGGKVVIEIEDDGRGINKKKILEKAINKGLVAADSKMSDSDICALIFHPGLTSVDKVTDLSGRGVGMDVVRRSIDQLQGKVEIESESGKGTKVSLEIPFTLAITDGMLVSVGKQKFIIPTMNIEKTFRVKKEEIFTVLGASEQVRYRGKVVPVLRLHEMFSISEAEEKLENATMLVIKNNGELYALLVDEVIGQQQLVGKSINLNVKMKHISGGAILGDGKVGLILDTAALVA